MSRITHLLNRTCIHKRTTGTFTEGQMPESLATLATGVAYRRYNIPADKALLLAQQLRADVVVVIYVEPDLEIAVEDVLVDETDGTSYRARLLDRPSIGVYRKVMATEIQLPTTVAP